jgi:hypothetical protein
LTPPDQRPPCLSPGRWPQRHEPCPCERHLGQPAEEILRDSVQYKSVCEINGFLATKPKWPGNQRKIVRAFGHSERGLLSRSVADEVRARLMELRDDHLRDDVAPARLRKAKYIGRALDPPRANIRLPVDWWDAGKAGAAIAAAARLARREAAKAFKARAFAPIPEEVVSARKARHDKLQAARAALQVRAQELFIANDIGNEIDDEIEEVDPAAFQFVHNGVFRAPSIGDHGGPSHYEALIGLEYEDGHSMQRELHRRRTGKVVPLYGETQLRTDLATDHWLRDNAPHLFEPAEPEDIDYTARNELRARQKQARRAINAIRSEPYLWADWCAARALYRRDTNKVARIEQALAWLDAPEADPKAEEARQIFRRFLRSRLSQRGFSEIDGRIWRGGKRPTGKVNDSKLRTAIDVYCQAVARRARPISHKLVVDTNSKTVLRGWSSILKATGWPRAAIERTIDDGSVPIAMLDGQPVMLRELLDTIGAAVALPSQSRAKAALPCPDSNHAKPQLAAE